MTPPRSQEVRRALILLVDDDPHARMFHAAALEAGGFDVLPVSTGTAAIETFENTLPDCLVLDVLMPDLTGYEVCAKIRKLVHGRHVPMLILTSLNEVDSISLAYAAGASDFAHKGIPSVQLVERVRFLVRAYELQRHLADSEARLAEAQRIARMGHWELDLEGRTVSVSAVALEMLDLSADSAVDFTVLADRVYGEDRSRFIEAVRFATRNDTRFSLDARVMSTRGERIMHFEGQMSDRNICGLERTLVMTVQDITELRQVEERARVLEFFDVATGLPNGAYLRNHLAEQLHKATSSTQIAMILIDVEHLNRVNDSLGTSAGDRLLSQMGQRLSRHVTELQSAERIGADFPPVVTRIGGDEFGIEMQLDQHADSLPEILNALHAKLHEPFDVDGQEISVSVTMGVAVAPDDAGDAENLLRCADSALHQAKNSARGSHQFYSAKLQARAAMRLSIESDLRRAIERNQLQLHYQPRIALATCTPTGVEALLRWHHPQRGWISPAEFIPIAEELGIIVEIGAWVMRQALAQAVAWVRSGIRLSVAVNVSAAQFQRTCVCTQVAEALAASGATSDLLELEITEGTLIERPQWVRATLEKLRGDGIRIALDDFGTGYSSLAYLGRLPLDSLKIDRSFIAAAHEREGSRLIRGIVALAHSLGLRIVAEGVETHEQLQFLADIDCEEVQGYLLAKPMPAASMAQWLADWFRQDLFNRSIQPKNVRYSAASA